jgi:hypothetical protein
MNTIQIAGKIYTVDICDSRKKYCETRSGWTCPDELKIVIDNRPPVPIQSEVLIHEVLEIVNSQFQLELSHPTICALGECLFQSFKPLQAIIGALESQI